MSFTVQQVICNPNKIFCLDNASLREELKAKKSDVLNAFFVRLSDKQWLETLETDQIYDLLLKVHCVLPEHAMSPVEPSSQTSILGIKIKKKEKNAQEGSLYDLFMTTVKKIPGAPPEPVNAFEAIYTENRPFYLAVTRKKYCQQFIDQPSDQKLLLYILCQALNNPLGYSEAGILKFLEKEDLSIADKVGTVDLLELGLRFDSAPILQKVLAIYSSQRESSDFIAERLMQEFPWKNNLSIIELIFNYLPVEKKQRVLEVHAGFFVMAFAMANKRELLGFVLQRMKSDGIDPKLLHRGRHKCQLTTLEKFLLMLGICNPVKDLVQAYPPKDGTSVSISTSDRMYRTFDCVKVEKELAVMRAEIMAYLRKYPDKKSVWSEPELIQKTHDFLKKALLETAYLFRNAWEKSGCNEKAMGTLLDSQNCEGSYIHRFFHGSFIEMYHLARGKAVFKADGLGLHLSDLKPSDEDPFFDVNQNQYHWRMMYNACGLLFQHFGIDSNDRGLNNFSWTNPDHKRRIG